MKETYDVAIEKVFVFEGGYSNNPKDPGGATNWGITIIDARRFWKPDATPEDVRTMPKSVAAGIYRTKYAPAVAYDALPAGVDFSVLDAGINSGVGRAIPWLADAMGVPHSSVVSLASSIGAVKDKQGLIQSYWQRRLSFLQHLKTWVTFGGGWGKRITSGEAFAVALWLKWGAKATPIEQKAELQKQAANANKKSAGHSKAATGSGTVGTGTAGSATQVPHEHVWQVMEIILLGSVIAVLVGLTVYFVLAAVKHKRRADAYSAEVKAVGI